MASVLLGVLGKARSGKDTFAARLVENHGFTRLAFADALKAAALDADPYIVWDGAVHRLSDLVRGMGWERAKSCPEVRRYLQAFGVSARDHIDSDVWVDVVYRAADEIPGPVVVTDVRFENEVEMILSEGGTTVRIHRPSLVSTDTHVSETLLNDTVVDLTVVNDGTLDGLHAKADEVAAILAEEQTLFDMLLDNTL